MPAVRDGTGEHSTDPNRLGRDFKARLADGPVLLGGIVNEYLRPSLVKLYRRAGFDFIYVENEHGMLMTPTLTDFSLASRDNGLPLIAKVADLDRKEVARLLEAGAVGIQLPRTEERDQLLELLDFMRFPPRGSRAGAPCYGNVDYCPPADHSAWLRGADAATFAVAHIETRRGYDNAEAIVTTPGLDALYVGPYDFSIAMGHPGDFGHDAVREPMCEILDLCVRHGVAFGTTAKSPQAAADWIARGCRFFEVIDELSLIAQAATDTVEAYRDAS